MSASEVQARLTAASAALGDYRRWTAGGTARGDWQSWARRLAAELASTCTGLRGALEKPGPLEQLGAEAVVRQMEQIRLVLDAFDWEHDDRQYALEQIDDILRGDR